ncbi:N-acetylmuramoyl-L-alanine amidase [Shimia sp.]|uniref:N-acetylmuramoyl-L-alanine amidase n=1 Tax=Shimia sp. TaxID=1954381 RepID=UPI003BA8FD5A
MTQPLKTQLTWRSDLDFTGLRFKMRDETLGCTVHCSASRPSQDWDAIDVDRMHRQRGWLCIGYHFVISRDGVIHAGRPMDARGAHCKHGGRNKTHISVCLIGGVSERPQEHVPGNPWNGSDAEANFTDAQATSLDGLLDFLKGTYGFTDEEIEGHRDVKGVRKACPSHDVQHFLRTGAFSLN